MIVSDVPVDQNTINSLPANWQMMQVDQIAKVGIGRTPARENSEYWQNGEVPWVSIADLNNGLVTQTKEQVSRKAFEEVFHGKAITPGTILLSFKLTIGKVGILGISALHNEAIASLTLTDDDIDRDYLFYTLQNLNYSSYLDTYVKGKTLNKDKIKALAIPFPPISEQKAIAQVLRTVQAAIQARRDELELEHERNAALMQFLFTHGTHREPLKQTEIGEIPESWSVLKVDKVITLQRGFDITRKEQRPGKIPVISSSGTLSYHDTAKVKGPGVIIGRKGSIGTAFYVEEDYWPHDTTLWVKDFHGNDPKFVYYFLKSLKVMHLDVGSSNPTLNRNHVHMILVGLPMSSEEQREIVEVLKASDKKINTLEQEVVFFEELFHTLLEELMTGQLSTLPLIAEGKSHE